MSLPRRSATFKVRIRGEWACFTRPEPREERISYDVMTPSAARGVLEAILWKPALQWRVERIHILAPIRLQSFKRANLSENLKLSGAIGRFLSDEKREPRDTLLLRDVDYVVEASFALTAEAGPDDDLKKFEETFLHRLARGECFHNPFLGFREFDARVEPAPLDWTVPEELRGRRELGLMLLDIRFQDRYGKKPVTPLFFHAIMENGVIEVPEAPR